MVDINLSQESDLGPDCQQKRWTALAIRGLSRETCHNNIEIPAMNHCNLKDLKAIESCLDLANFQA